MTAPAPMVVGGRALGPCAVLIGALLGGCSLVADLDRAAPEGLGGADEGPQSGDRGVDLDAAIFADAGPQPDARRPDESIEAGIEAGTDAALDAGPDAALDAGPDAALDAGLDAAVDAGPPVPTGAPLVACTDAFVGQQVRLPCDTNPAIDRVWACEASGQPWTPSPDCRPTPPHWCAELCTGCTPPFALGTVDRIRLSAPAPPYTAPFPFDAILATGDIQCDGCDGQPPDAVVDQVYARRFGLGGPDEVARDLIINCTGGDCLGPPVVTLRYVASAPEPDTGLPWRYRMASHLGPIPEGGPAEMPLVGLLPSDVLQLVEWWFDERGVTSWRVWLPDTAQTCATDTVPDGPRSSSRCAPEMNPPTATEPPRTPQVDEANVTARSRQQLDAAGMPLRAVRRVGEPATADSPVDIEVALDFSCWHCPPGADACVRREVPADRKCQVHPGRSPLGGLRPWTVVCGPMAPADAEATCSAAGGRLATIRDIADRITLGRFAPTVTRPAEGGQPAYEPGHLVGGRFNATNDEVRWPGDDGLLLEALGVPVTDLGDGGRCLLVLAGGDLRAVPCNTGTIFRFACEFVGAEGLPPEVP